jgi:RHS repeat-associated protein
VTRTYTHDKVQRVLTRTNELGRITTFTYDPNSNKLTETVPLTATLNAVTTWTYDDANRVLTVKDPLNTIVSTYSYDKHGNRLTFKDGNNHQTSYEYDRANRLIKVTDPLGGISEFVFDKNGNRTSLKDPRSKTQTFAYDAVNRLTTETTPTALSQSFTYSLDNLKASATDFNGSATAFTYDSARRLKLIDYPGTTPDVEHSYDKGGNRLSMKENGVTTATYTFDELNRLLTDTRGAAVVTYSYDRRDLTGLKFPDNKQLTYTLDAAGNLSTLDDWRGAATGRTSYGYDFANRKTSQTLPNGAVSNWSHDNASRLLQVEHKPSAAGPAFATFTYSYDNAGNRLTLASSDGTTVNQSFVYDAAHRLTSETRSGVATTYGYDPAGNRTSMTLGADVTTYPPDDDNRLTEIKLNAVTTATFAYDNNGSLTSKTVPGVGTTTYTPDAARRLTSVFPAGGSQVSFAYDGDGARKSKTAASGTSTYVNDTQGLTRVLQETRGANTLSYVPGILQHDPAQVGNAQWAYFHADAQNNRALTDQIALVSKRWEFDPFGVVRAETGTAASDFQYAGEQKDSETGLINLRARYYEPGIGRLLSRDSVQGRTGAPQSFNRFAYVLNNPLRYVDPSGFLAEGGGDCHSDNPECREYYGPGDGDPDWNSRNDQSWGPNSGDSSTASGGSTPAEPRVISIQDVFDKLANLTLDLRDEALFGSGPWSACPHGASCQITGGLSNGRIELNYISAFKSPQHHHTYILVHSDDEFKPFWATSRGEGVFLKAVTGAWTPASIEWGEKVLASQTVIRGNLSFGSITAAIRRFAQNLNSANVVYKILTDNSNSWPHQAMECLDLDRPQPPVDAPGWDSKLPVAC